MLYRTSRQRAFCETPCFAQVNASTGFIRRIKRELQQPITPLRPAPAPHHAHTAPAPQHHGHHGTDYGYPKTPQDSIMLAKARLLVKSQEMVHALHQPKAASPPSRGASSPSSPPASSANHVTSTLFPIFFGVMHRHPLTSVPRFQPSSPLLPSPFLSVSLSQALSLSTINIPKSVPLPPAPRSPIGQQIPDNWLGHKFSKVHLIVLLFSAQVPGN